MATRRKTVEICSCSPRQVRSQNLSSESSESSSLEMDPNEPELRNFSSMDTLSEVSDLPRNQPLKASKTRLDLYNSPIKRRYDKPVQTKPNLLGAASAHRLNVSETSQCGSSPISSRMDSEKRNKVKFKEVDEADNNIKASAGDAKVTLSGMSKWKYPRNESFIVDMNNPPDDAPKEDSPPKAKNDSEDIKVVKSRDEPDKKDDTSKAQNSAPNAGGGTPSSIYYPSKSPMRQFDNAQNRKTRRGLKVNDRYVLTIALIVATVVAFLLYIVLLGLLIDTHDRVIDVETELAKFLKSNVSSTKL